MPRCTVPVSPMANTFDNSAARATRPSSSSSVPPRAAPHQQWQCPSCTLHNAAAELVCAACRLVPFDVCKLVEKMTQNAVDEQIKTVDCAKLASPKKSVARTSQSSCSAISETPPGDAAAETRYASPKEFVTCTSYSSCSVISESPPEEAAGEICCMGETGAAVSAWTCASCGKHHGEVYHMYHCSTCHHCGEPRPAAAAKAAAVESPRMGVRKQAVGLIARPPARKWKRALGRLTGRRRRALDSACV